VAQLMIKKRHQPWVYGVAWSPDGQRIVSACAQERAQVWEVSDGKTRVTYLQQGLQQVAWLPDGARIATAGDNTVQIWDATTGAHVLTYSGHTDHIRALALSPDGRHVATGGHDNTAQVWEAATGRLLFTYTGHGDWILSLAWSPDGRYIASAGDEGVVRIWEAATGASVCAYYGHAQLPGGLGPPNRSDSRIGTLAWSPDGTRIVSGSLLLVQVWEAMTGTTLLTYRDQPGHRGPVAWSPDGERIASAEGWPGVIQIWDPSTGETTDSCVGHASYIFALAWSPDGRFIASGGRDRTTQVWKPSRPLQR